MLIILVNFIFLEMCSGGRSSQSNICVHVRIQTIQIFSIVYMEHREQVQILCEKYLLGKRLEYSTIYVYPSISRSLVIVGVVET